MIMPDRRGNRRDFKEDGIPRQVTPGISGQEKALLQLHENIKPPDRSDTIS